MQAEHFLVNVISKKNESCNTFSELRVKLYHHSRDKKFIDLPCSSNEAHQYIRRAYMQTVRLWIEAPFRNFVMLQKSWIHRILDMYAT